MSRAPQAVFLDLLMATMRSIDVWRAAARDADRGLAWRDAVTQRMIDAGRYVPYDGLMTDAAAALDLDSDAPGRLVAAWHAMRPWPDASAVAHLAVPYAFVTNCTAELAAVAADRSKLRPSFVLSAEEAAWYKPHPQIYRLACERAGVDPEDALFVAGAAYDAEGAAATGLEAVLVCRRAPPPSLSPRIRLVATLGEALAR